MIEIEVPMLLRKLRRYGERPPGQHPVIQRSLNELLGTTQTAADGSFSLNAAVPAGAQPGAATIQAECIVDSFGPLTTDFTVTAPLVPPEPSAPAAAEPVTAAPVFTG